MKKAIVKIISTVLALSLMFAIVAIPASAADTVDYPIVYVMGKNQTLYKADGTQIYPFEKSTTEYIKDGFEPVMKALTQALITNNWDVYYDSIYDAIAPIYTEIVADKDGNVREDDRISATNRIPAKTSNFSLNDYHFNYDWRLDPFEIADQLHDYVEQIKKITGKDKVCLIGRCFGGNVVSAYITKYGCDDIDQVLFCAVSTMGVEPAGALFSGKIEFTPDVLDKYLTYNVDSEGNELLELAKAFVPILRQLSVLDLGTDMVNKISKEIFKNVIPRVLRSSYGTFASYWAMVGTEYYEDAKKFVFGGMEDEYATLIEKIDNYQYNVQQKLADTIKEYKSLGMKYSNISKYNIQLPPLTSNSDQQADGQVAVFEQSLGAKSAKIGQTFTDEYIGIAASNNNDKYISADKKIDASTCLAPDSTWFIRDISHDAYTESVQGLMITILKSADQPTVWDNETYPQYLIYNEDKTLSPVVSEDVNDDKWSNNIITSFIRFIKKFFAWIVSIFQK